MADLLRIDLSQKKIERTPVPDKYRQLGGRGFTSTMINDEVDPLCHPLSPDNKFIVAPGILAGTNVSSSGRTSFAGKSPLTKGIKESNVGGTIGMKLARLNIAGIVFEGKSDKLVTLYLSKDAVRFDDAEALQDTLIYDAVASLQVKYGKDVAIAAIGPAGEALMAGACIGITDVDGAATRQAGRGGLGALMGSKNLKAIVADDTGTSAVQVADKDGLKEAVKAFAKMIKDHPMTGQELPRYGTNGVVNVINAVGAYPTRNFSEGRFEGVSEICGEKMYEIITERKAKPTDRCMPGCLVQCSNTYNNEKGEEITGGFEYETIWAFGANCGISDLDALAELNRLCDDIGVDTIETGVAIGVAMEAAVIEFGDTQGAIGLVKEIQKKTPMGRILGNGAQMVGGAFGVVRVPVVKGQAIPGYDPRAIKGMGVCYALSPMGADHTSAYTTAPEIYNVGGDLDPLSPEGKVELVQQLLAMNAALDSIGLCFMACVPLFDNSEGLPCLVKMITAKTGDAFGMDELMNLGSSIIATEMDFNKRAGFSKAHNRLPRFFRTEKLAPLNVVNDVDENEIDAASV